MGHENPGNYENESAAKSEQNAFVKMAQEVPSFGEHMQRMREDVAKESQDGLGENIGENTEKRRRDEEFTKSYVEQVTSKVRMAYGERPGAKTREDLEAAEWGAKEEAKRRIDILHAIEDFSLNDFTEAISNDTPTKFGDEYRELAKDELENAKKALLDPLSKTYSTKIGVLHGYGEKDRLGRDYQADYASALKSAKELAAAASLLDGGSTPSSLDPVSVASRIEKYEKQQKDDEA